MSECISLSTKVVTTLAVTLTVGCGRDVANDIASAIAAEVPGAGVQVERSVEQRRIIISLTGSFAGDSAQLAPTAERVARRAAELVAADSIVDVGVVIWSGTGMSAMPLGYRYRDSALSALKKNK